MVSKAITTPYLIRFLMSSFVHSGFVQVNYDVSWVQPNLASNVSEFMYKNRHLIPADANQHFVWKGDAGIAKAMAGTAGNDDWTGACMYVSKQLYGQGPRRSLTVKFNLAEQFRNITSQCVGE